MLVATLVGVLLVPGFYIIVERLFNRSKDNAT